MRREGLSANVIIIFLNVLLTVRFCWDGTPMFFLPCFCCFDKSLLCYRTIYLPLISLLTSGLHSAGTVLSYISCWKEQHKKTAAYKHHLQNPKRTTICSCCIKKLTKGVKATFVNKRNVKSNKFEFYTLLSISPKDFNDFKKSSCTSWNVS